MVTATKATTMSSGQSEVHRRHMGAFVRSHLLHPLAVFLVLHRSPDLPAQFMPPTEPKGQKKHPTQTLKP